MSLLSQDAWGGGKEEECFKAPGLSLRLCVAPSWLLLSFPVFVTLPHRTESGAERGPASLHLSAWLKSRGITGLASRCFLGYLFPVFHVFMNFGFVDLAYTICNHENVIKFF